MQAAAARQVRLTSKKHVLWLTQLPGWVVSVCTGDPTLRVAGVMWSITCCALRAAHPAEVKNQELFGVHSGHYLGGSGKGKGLAEQVAQMLAVAAAPQHKRRGRSPQVVVYFPSGVDDEVAAALTALGAKVANGTGSLAAVCGIVGNNVTNLDVTTLCALVSEVSWRDPYCDELQAWGARTTHWKVRLWVRHGYCGWWNWCHSTLVEGCGSAVCCLQLKI
jgi:hypothetical protein